MNPMHIPIHNKRNCGSGCRIMVNISAIARELGAKDKTMDYSNSDEQEVEPIIMYPLGPFNRPATVPVTPVSKFLTARDITTIGLDSAEVEVGKEIEFPWLTLVFIALITSMFVVLLLFLGMIGWFRTHMLGCRIIRIIRFGRGLCCGSNNLRMSRTGGPLEPPCEPSGESACMQSWTTIPRSPGCVGLDGNDYPPNIPTEPNMAKMKALTKTAFSSSFPPTHFCRMNMHPPTFLYYYENEMARGNIPNNHYVYSVDQLDIMQERVKDFATFYQSLRNYFKVNHPGATTEADEIYWRLLAWQWRKQLAQRQNRELRLRSMINEPKGNNNGNGTRDKKMGNKKNEQELDNGKDAECNGYHKEGSIKRYEQLGQDVV